MRNIWPRAGKTAITSAKFRPGRDLTKTAALIESKIMTEINVVPQPLDGFSVLTNDQDAALKAVAFMSGETQFAFPVNKELAETLAKVFTDLANELPAGPQAN